MPDITKLIDKGHIVLPCVDLNKTLDFFVDRLDFVVESVFPADNPSVISISGYGLGIVLEGEADNQDANRNTKLRLSCPNPKKVFDGELSKTAPNGVTIELIDSNPEITLPEIEPSLVINKISDEARWVSGRAGMRYRDLIPGRQGGSFIASHIHIPEAGPVPDYVHYHEVRFQIIYCYKGWARVVYEDQGKPFILSAGECVLQPPGIRHRVLESSANMEVIEVSSPAAHFTRADLKMTLPTETVDADRDFSGQRFVHYRSDGSDWVDWRIDGFECRDTGITAATNGLGSVKIVRPKSKVNPELVNHEFEFAFLFVLKGSMSLLIDARESETVGTGDSIVIPSGLSYSLGDCSGDLEILEVTYGV